MEPNFELEIISKITEHVRNSRYLEDEISVPLFDITVKYKAKITPPAQPPYDYEEIIVLYYKIIT